MLIIASDWSLPSNPEAVPRRPAKLTKENRQKLKSQGVPSDCQDEVAITQARYNKFTEVMVRTSYPKKLLRKDVMKSIAHLLNYTKCDTGKRKCTVVCWCINLQFIYCTNNIILHCMSIEVHDCMLSV